MPIQQLLILADDLTGAADCTAGCVKAGLATAVMLAPDAVSTSDSKRFAALSIDADTRHMAPHIAGRLQSDLYGRYRQPSQLLYKKIDSTLRGNIAAEVAALLEDAGMAVVAPAFPQAGRTTRKGRQYLHNIALEHTEIWCREGVDGTSDMPLLLASHGIRTVTIPLDLVRGSFPLLCRQLQQAAADGMQAVVVDAETDADLNVIALASLTLSPPFFLVGSAGLAEHVPAAARLAGTPACRPDVVTSGAILTVVGSVSATSRQQADVLTQLRALARIDVPPALLDDEPSAADWAQCQSRLGQAIADGSDVLLVIEDPDTADLRRGRTVCRALAQLVAPHTNSIGGLISTGGETTRAILLAMGIDAMRVVGQVEAGIPLSLAAGQRAIPIISKAGGFGTADTLVHCYDTLARARSAVIHEESIPATAPGHYNYPQ